MTRIIKDGSRYLTDDQQKAVDLANARTTHPKNCPVCGEKLRLMSDPLGFKWYECLNMIVRVTGQLYTGSGEQACNYKWYYPKDRHKIC